jgi:hypothetical protein
VRANVQAGDVLPIYEKQVNSMINSIIHCARRRLSQLTLAACFVVMLQGTSARATWVQHAGTNMFVIGIYDYAGGPPPIHNDVVHLSEMSNYCNTIAIYDHDWDDSAWLQNLTSLTAANLNAAASNGMCIVDQMWTENYYGSNNVDNWMCMSPEFPAEYELKTGSGLYNQLTAFSNNPALLMWENMDEVGVNWWNNEVPNPDYMDPTLTNYVDDGNFMLKYGGGKPVWVNDGCFFYQNGDTPVSYCNEWAGGGTVYSQDCYPSSSSGNVDDIKRDMDFINVVSNASPHFMVLEAYDTGWNYTNRMYMTYSAIIHGANGVWWWGACQVPTNSQTWQIIKMIGSQLQAMGGALTHPSAYSYYDTYTSSWVGNGITDSGGYVEMLMISSATTDYLITANTANSTQNFTVNSVAGWRGGANLWYYFGAGGTNQVMGQTITYAPKQVVVYASQKIRTSPIVTLPQPSPQVCATGNSASFYVGDVSWWPETYQWYLNGTPLNGQTNSMIALNNVQSTNAGIYDLVISNAEGNSTDEVNLVVYTNLITWQAPVEISGASDVATNGKYFGSWAPYDGSANSLPVNGTAFHGVSDLPGFSNNFPSGNGGALFNSPHTGNANYNNLLEYATWANGANAQFSWGGMTPGHTYEIQLWVEDCRTGVTDARWENVSGSVAGTASYGTDSSDPVGYSAPLFSSPAGNPGYYITGTFVADGTGSEQILLTGWDLSGGNPSAQINLFQVRDITSIAPSQLDITGISLSGSNFIINGTNGTAGLQFAVLTSTNISRPLAQWIPIMTNTFSGTAFSVTNAVRSDTPENFYVLELL